MSERHDARSSRMMISCVRMKPRPGPAGFDLGRTAGQPTRTHVQQGEADGGGGSVRTREERAAIIHTPSTQTQAHGAREQRAAPPGVVQSASTIKCRSAIKVGLRCFYDRKVLLWQ